MKLLKHDRKKWYQASTKIHEVQLDIQDKKRKNREHICDKETQYFRFCYTHTNNTQKRHVRTIEEFTAVLGGRAQNNRLDDNPIDATPQNPVHIPEHQQAHGIQKLRK